MEYGIYIVRPEWDNFDSEIPPSFIANTLGGALAKGEEYADNNPGCSIEVWNEETGKQLNWQQISLQA